MATPATVLKDPNFHALPLEERRKVMVSLDPQGFGALPAQEQDKVFVSAAGNREPSEANRALAGTGLTVSDPKAPVAPQLAAPAGTTVGGKPIRMTAAQEFEFKRQQAVEEAKHPPMSAMDTAQAAGEQAIGAIAAPVAGIPAAAREVGRFVAGGLHAPTLNPDGTPTGPDYAKGNPLTDAQGNLMLAAATSRGTPEPTVKPTGTVWEQLRGAEPKVRAAEVPSPKASSLPSKLPWLAKKMLRRIPLVGDDLVDMANNYLKNKQAPATPDPVPSPAEAATATLLDDIAMGQTGRKFASLSPEQQAGVRNIANRMGEPQAEATPAPTPGRFSAEEFRSPTPPPAEVSASVPESPQVSAPNKAMEAQQALRDAMVESGTAPPAAPPSATAVGETMHQLNRTGAASNIAQSLHENGISAAQFQRLRKLNMPMLEKLAKQLGHDLSDPSSWEQVGTELKKLSSKKAAAVSQ